MASRPLQTPAFVKVVEIQADALDASTDYLSRMRRGALTAVIVRGLYSTADVATVCARLEASDDGLRRFPLSSDSEAYTLGALLVTASEGLTPYFEEVPRIEALCARVFEGFAAPRSTILHALAQLNGGTEVQVPVHHDGSPYPLLSIRRVPAESQLAAHCEKEQLKQPTYAHLGPTLDDSTLLSCFVALNDVGPVDPLVLYDLVVEGPVPHLSLVQKAKLRAAIEHKRQYRVPLRAGDMVVFDGGRHYHRVSPSARDRWTMGGFLAFANDGRVLAWT